MAQRYDHLRAKAIELRTKHQMTLDDIIEWLALPRATVYYWIKDIPIPRTERQIQNSGQKLGTAAMQAKFAARREAAYQQGLDELPELLQDVTFRDFVVLYMAEGTKRDRNSVSFVNSDARMVKLAHRWMYQLTTNKEGLDYRIQYHIDHDESELKAYWAEVLGISPDVIKTMRKSNSGQLAKRQWRSEHGLMTVRVGDTYFRSRLEAWMDIIKSQW